VSGPISFYLRCSAAVFSLAAMTWIVVSHFSGPQANPNAFTRPALVPTSAISTGDVKSAGDWVLCEDGVADSFNYACTVWSDAGKVLMTGTFVDFRNGAKTVGPAAKALAIVDFRGARILTETGYLEREPTP